MRQALFDATRLADQQFVTLVSGAGGGKSLQTRERVFAGFNTPLLPEVLVCTAVGQEGIDLHRHCRHVIHYDLAWNPAVLEQRTGRQ
jgi:superfamily II DNA/RNA helicase